MSRKHYCAAWIALAGCASLPAIAADLLRQSADDAMRKSVSCVSSGCHTAIEPMHASPAVRLGCTDCHGGRADSTDKNEAHVQARLSARVEDQRQPRAIVHVAQPRKDGVRPVPQSGRSAGG